MFELYNRHQRQSTTASLVAGINATWLKGKTETHNDGTCKALQLGYATCKGKDFPMRDIRALHNVQPAEVRQPFKSLS